MPPLRKSTGKTASRAKSARPVQRPSPKPRLNGAMACDTAFRIVARRHLDADEILERAQKLDRNVTRVTVYRTLDLLKRHGLIDELDLLHLRGDRHFYESHGPRDHIHVACLRCGKVREVESPLYEELKQQIARDCNIEISVSRTEVGGICADCQRAAKPRATA